MIYAHKARKRQDVRNGSPYFKRVSTVVSYGFTVLLFEVVVAIQKRERKKGYKKVRKAS